MALILQRCFADRLPAEFFSKITNLAVGSSESAGYGRNASARAAARLREYAEKAARISALALDISEFLEKAELPPAMLQPRMTVAYHSACSMQHGQKITTAPQRLLRLRWNR